MRISAPCIRCLVERQEERIRRFEDADAKAGYLKEVLRIIGSSEEEATAPVLVARIRKKYEEYFGRDHGYEEEKHSFNRKMLAMEPQLKQNIRQAQDPLRYALTLARVGNYIDFGATNVVEDQVLTTLLQTAGEDLVEERVYKIFTQELCRAQSLVYLVDNCGEVVLDKLVIELLKERFPKLQITAVVRGSAVLNDVTLEDALEVGLLKVTDVLENGTDIAGTDLASVNRETRQALEAADVILSKGQGNFETLHGCGLNIYYLFLCKCDWFVNRFGLTRNAGVFIREEEL